LIKVVRRNLFNAAAYSPDAKMTNNFASVIPSTNYLPVKHTSIFRTLSSFTKSLSILMTRYYRVQLHLNRGRILYHLGQFDAALDDFRAALRLDWRNEKAMSWIDCAGRAEDKSGLTSTTLRKNRLLDFEAHCLVAAKAIIAFL
jgi:tetratricopeptide (TPR) repeat protein